MIATTTTFLIAVVVGFSLFWSAAAQDVTLVQDLASPGTTPPTEGRSLFDELFEIGHRADNRADARYQIPYPFKDLIARVASYAAPGSTKAVLIPLGRSLQRSAADPDFFASPRVVLAVVADREVMSGLDAKPPNVPYLKDRLFIGYQARAQVLEVISYNEVAGRFEFQLVEGYGEGQEPRVEYVERSVCVVCHQGHAPIFSIAEWGETNANPDIAERLARVSDNFHGVPVRSGIDFPDALDQSTDRASWIAFANFVWQQACGFSHAAGAAECRAQLLLLALRYRLGGARGNMILADPQAEGAALALTASLRRAAPAGLGIPSPNLPNRNPLKNLLGSYDVDRVLNPGGSLDPAQRRNPLVFWSTDDPSERVLFLAISTLGGFFSDNDIVWLDRRLGDLVATGSGDKVFKEDTRVVLPCRLVIVERDQLRQELRFDCRNGQSSQTAALSGYVTIESEGVGTGVVRRIALDRGRQAGRLTIAGGVMSKEGDWTLLSLSIKENVLGLSARLSGGQRIKALLLRYSARPDDESADKAHAELVLTQENDVLEAAIAQLVELGQGSRGQESPGRILMGGPLQRRSVMAALNRVLTGASQERSRAEPLGG